MTHYCLDACSLINLFCGWGGLQELHTFGDSWSTSGTALGEFNEVREWKSDGTIVKASITSAAICLDSPLTVHYAISDEESVTLMRLSKIIDDGEACCLALAKHRKLILLTRQSKACYHS